MTRLVTDSDLGNKSKKIFEVIQQDTHILDGYNQDDIDKMLGVLKLLNFSVGECICQEG